MWFGCFFIQLFIDEAHSPFISYFQLDENRVLKLMASISICLFITIVFFIMSFFLTRLEQPSNEERPFECGLNAKSDIVRTFSFHFFLIAVLFLIFDVEISLLVPFIMERWVIENINNIYFILIMLILGLFFEWKGGKINWSNWMRLLSCK